MHSTLYYILVIVYEKMSNVFFFLFHCVRIDERGHVCVRVCVWHFYSVFQSKLQYFDSEWAFEVSVLDLQTTAFLTIRFSLTDIERNALSTAQINENMALNYEIGHLNSGR